MLKVTVIGAEGFVGSAFVRLLGERTDVDLRAVTRANYAEVCGTKSDVVIDAAGNSKKYVADQDPARDFDASVAHRMRTLFDFPAALQLHVSSVDVYADLTSPATTMETSSTDGPGSSTYGFHKRLAEELVQRHAEGWLIVRLAGMVGPGLRKNPVFDVLTGRPLTIHPDSQYQFMHADEAARTALALAESGKRGEIFNVCGSGLVSPRDIAAMAGRAIDDRSAPAHPRIVRVNTEKIERLQPMPESKRTIASFVSQWKTADMTGQVAR